MTEIKKVTLTENELDQISGGISAKKVLLIGGLALLGISTAAAGAYFAYKHGLFDSLFGSKTHPNANPLELGDDIWDEAEKQGKIQEIIAANKAARSANTPSHLKRKK